MRGGRSRVYRIYSARTLGLWLLYAFVGALIGLMLLAGGGDLGGDQSRSPTRTRTKLLGAASGLALAVAALGLYLSNDPTALPTWPRWMVWVGAPLGAALTPWTWAWIARDLNGGRRRG
jgi:hypothetical protein